MCNKILSIKHWWIGSDIGQGFIQDFSTGGGGQHLCHCAATHVRRGGGEIMPGLT